MKYITDGVRRLALIAGVALFGITTLGLFLFGVARPWAWGMIVGALFAFAVTIFLAFINHREYTKFSEAESRVEGTVLEFSLATVSTLGVTRRAYVFLTQETLRLFLWDKRPYLESTIHRDEVVIRYIADKPDRLVLTYEDNDTIELSFPDARAMIAALQKNGYRIEEIKINV